jgi:hypothetical protein
VAVHVIDGFKKVEVEQEQRAAAAGTGGAIQLLRQPWFEQPARRGPGDRIGDQLRDRATALRCAAVKPRERRVEAG